MQLVYASVLLCVGLIQAHSVILSAVGDSGESVGFQVNPAIARNCTTINPCQQDATIIRDAEIAANLVNECGRTELTGNIDVGENTENALAAGAVTQVQKGSKVTVTIHQVNADGAGPYVCDLDLTSNSNGVKGQIPLKVENNVPGVNGFSQAKTQQFNITVTLPDDLACTGASTGNVCTVRCRNNAVAGPFGGCFAVQQTDIDGKTNTPANINTLQSLDVSEGQVLLNQQDFPAAVSAIQNAGTDQALQNAAVVSSILNISITSKTAAVQTPDVDASSAADPAADSTAKSDVPAVETSSIAQGTNDRTRNRKGNGNTNNQNNRSNNNDNNSNRNDNNRRSLFSTGLRWARRGLPQQA